MDDIQQFVFVPKKKYRKTRRIELVEKKDDKYSDDRYSKCIEINSSLIEYKKVADDKIAKLQEYNTKLENIITEQTNLIEEYKSTLSKENR